MKVENIKFKAKRLDNSEWVEGYFYKECGNILPGAGYKVDFKDHRITKAISLTNKKK